MRPWTLLAVLFTGCASTSQASDPAPVPEGAEIAVFAGGCFWCMEKPFDALDGVLDTTSGYTGGTVDNPTYSQVSAGSTGHTEALRVTYDPSKVSYDKLLTVFWHNIDPLDAGGQFCDRGSQYRSAIFPQTDAQKTAAEASLKATAEKLGKELATKLEPKAPFYSAEDYHQNYYETHPVRYTYYRNACGRDRRLGEVWGEAAAH